MTASDQTFFCPFSVAIAYFLITSAAIFMSPHPVHAQRSDMYQAVKKFAIAGQDSLQKGYRFFDISALMGTLLPSGERVEEAFELWEGQRYAFIAAGDDDPRDIDLVLTDMRGRPLEKDTRRDATAVVVFKPLVTARYRIVLSLLPRRTRSSFCAMTVLTTDRSRGYEMRTESLVDTLASLEASFQLAERAREHHGEDIDLKFHSGSNTWLLVGSILSHESGVTTDPKYFANGSYLALCVAEQSCSDANIYVKTESESVLQRGEDMGNFSMVAFRGGSQNLLSLTLENAYSRRPSFVLSAVLKLSYRE